MATLLAAGILSLASPGASPAQETGKPWSANPVAVAKRSHHTNSLGEVLHDQVASEVKYGPYNYKESKVPPYTLLDPVLGNDGAPVLTAHDWDKSRRTELLEAFREHIFGRRPDTSFATSLSDSTSHSLTILIAVVGMVRIVGGIKIEFLFPFLGCSRSRNCHVSRMGSEWHQRKSSPIDKCTHFILPLELLIWQTHAFKRVIENEFF